jgi:hypothetical protein
MIGRPAPRLLAGARLRFVRRRMRARRLLFAITVVPLLDVLLSITLVMLGWFAVPPP